MTTMTNKSALMLAAAVFSVWAGLLFVEVGADTASSAAAGALSVQSLASPEHGGGGGGQQHHRHHHRRHHRRHRHLQQPLHGGDGTTSNLFLEEEQHHQLHEEEEEYVDPLYSAAPEGEEEAEQLVVHHHGSLAEEDYVLEQQQEEAGKCPSCVADRELFKNFTREEIRGRILRKLGLTHAPNVSTSAVPTHLVRQLLSRYRSHLDVQSDQAEPGEFDEDDFHFQTRQINVIAQEPPPRTTLRLSAAGGLASSWEVQHFNLDGQQLRSHWREMTKAQLWVHLPAAFSPGDQHAWINLYVVSADKTGRVFLTQEAATKVKLRLDRDGWAELNVWDMVSLWFKHPEANLGLVIQVNTTGRQEIRVGAQSQPDFAPFLQLHIRESVTNNRRKRTLNKVCSEETDASETHCCLWPITIDFEREFGWKWIIHPPKYEANYCAGDCSLGVMMPSNPYSHLLQQANGNPCCAPQKMSGMNMLYMDENKNVILGKLPNMRVDRCGCI